MSPLRTATLSLFTTLLVSVLSFIPTAHANDSAKPEFQEKIANPQLLTQLKQGGFVLYMRHGNTDNSRPDRVPSVDLNDCNTQRVLNELGQTVTKQVGVYVRQAGIPVGEVFSSPMCRAKNSALNAFGHFTLEPAIMYTGGMTSAQKKPVLAKTRELISKPVAPGTNRFLVAHAPNMMDLMGYFPKEATLVIFKPKGHSQFDYLGSIRPQDWSELLKPTAATRE
ncbi:histidine phosphatase family protein [Thiosulfativibrio zosterae]|uniref:Histidine phosphatase family protein n=1 Tax=Thiosulfativibrio zosterae TaxID=2675053 RepID=A0A6F8PQU8_9GAMM|nr:histidine phosphatase family protein [Thiosulfativibrio zosterae]BBP44414.1 histidine phosphatase family protein [Thiosulfativibrio zosterae]